jgi:ABC-2 type transport system permease protein
MTAANRATAPAVGWSPPVLWAQLVSEYRKIVSTSSWWALLVPPAAISLLLGLTIAEIGGAAFSVTTVLTITLGTVGSKFAAIFGVVCSSAEFRHRTITTSYLSASGRPQLLAVKAVASAVVGAIYAVVCALLSVLGMLIGGASFDGDGSAFGISAASVLLFALWGVLGVGLGAVLANQLSAIIGLLVYLMLVEPLIIQFASFTDIGRIEDYLPGGAASATLKDLAVDSGSLGELFNASHLPWWASLLIFLGYTLVIYAAGTAVAQARDIT